MEIKRHILLPPEDELPSSNRPLPGEQGGARTGALVATVILVTAALGWFWLVRQRTSSKSVTDVNPAAQLSEATRAVLKSLGSPVEIRFYSVLDPATVPEATRAFAGRVDRLLSEYEQEGAGKIKMTRFDIQSNPGPNAALVDGVQGFNLDRGEPCYLGVTLAANGRKETLPHLTTEWEQALEADLTRAIVRLLDTGQQKPTPMAAAQLDTNAIEGVKSLIPNLATVTLEDGTRLLREAALKDFTSATQEMDKQLKLAEQALSRAQASGIEAEQQAAFKHLQQVQAEQSEKLKEIAARSKARLEALQQLKARSQ